MKFLNLKNFIYASSSSVYGDSKIFPFKENQDLNPLNFYGQTKLMNEKIANINIFGPNISSNTKQKNIRRKNIIRASSFEIF